jgi:glycosyltransferase involved in cell wall biosynthesis
LENAKNKSALKVFAVFFHPKTSITALGGAEKRFIETLKIFMENSVNFTVIEAAPSFLERQREIVCEKFIVSLSFQSNNWLGTYLEWAFWMVKAFFKGFPLVCRVKPHVILVPNNTLPNLACGFFLGLISRIPICVVAHHFDTPFPKVNSKEYSLFGSYREIGYNKLVSLVKSLAYHVSLAILKRVSAIIAVSRFTGQVLKAKGVSEAEILVSGNAVDLSFIGKVKPCFNKKVFDGIFVGRIAKEKGVFDLLKIWKNVVKARKNAKLLIVGNGIELSSVKKEVSVLGLENYVVMRNGCSDAELFGLLKSSKVFIFPSLFEGWGLAVAEALACGLPVVAYDIPALKEVFGECRSVFLVPVKNIESMTAIVLDLLNSTEADLSKLSSYSKVFSKQFCWKNIAKKDLELLKTFKK